MTTRTTLIALSALLALASTAAAQEARPVEGQPSDEVRRIEVRGRDTQRGPFKATLNLSPEGSGLRVTRTATFASGDPEVLVGSGRWLDQSRFEARLAPPGKGLIPALKATALLDGDLKLRLTIDEKSGFCVERLQGRERASRAQGRLQRPQPTPTRPAKVETEYPDLEGWTIPIPGDVRHAASDGERVYVAAGPRGLQVVDLETERVVGAVKLPGRASHVRLADGRAWVTTMGKGDPREYAVDLKRLRVVGEKAPKPRPVPKPLKPGELDVLETGGRRYVLTRNSILEHHKGKLIAQTDLGTPLRGGQHELVAVRGGVATLAVPGAGVVVLELE